MLELILIDIYRDSNKYHGPIQDLHSVVHNHISEFKDLAFYKVRSKEVCDSPVILLSLNT